jgi:hypothetical protein
MTRLNHFIYDYHEHFQQLRGTSRASNLHLCSFLAAGGLTYSSFYRPSIEETCLRLLRSCYSNRPLVVHEAASLTSILEKAFLAKMYSLALCCEVLVKTAQLSNAMSFKTIRVVVQSN